MKGKLGLICELDLLPSYWISVVLVGEDVRVERSQTVAFSWSFATSVDGNQREYGRPKKSKALL